jgi:hypothetical protein
LEFGVWSLEIWDLGFGVWSLEFGIAVKLWCCFKIKHKKLAEM